MLKECLVAFSSLLEKNTQRPKLYIVLGKPLLQIFSSQTESPAGQADLELSGILLYLDCTHPTLKFVPWQGSNPGFHVG